MIRQGDGSEEESSLLICHRCERAGVPVTEAAIAAGDVYCQGYAVVEETHFGKAGGVLEARTEAYVGRLPHFSISGRQELRQLTYCMSYYETV